MVALSTSSRPPFALLAYVTISIVLSIILLIDPLLNSPSGLIKLSWFTRHPVSHGLDACSWDYEGSWRIGFARGEPDPLHLNFSAGPVITCATISNATAVSFVADPFLFIPDPNIFKETDHQANATFSFHPTDGASAGGASASPPWFAFYEMKNLRRFTGELGTAVSYDQGATWRHLGTALSEPFHLSFPHVLYDTDSAQFLMFAETSGAADGAVRVYATSRAEFPFGWRLVAARRPADPGWAATRRWFQFGAAAKYVDTAPVRFQDRWWIFTTRVGTPAASQPKYTLLLYTAQTLLGDWEPHPATLAGAPFSGGRAGRVPYGVDANRSTARSGGRPFVLNGTLYRWAQDCSRYYGEALVLMRADVANRTAYSESVAVRYEPTRDGRSWRAERLHHADVQRLPDGSWGGLVDGDRYPDGRAHFVARELWFVELKAQLRWLVPVQLAVVLLAVLMLKVSYRGPAGGGAALRGWKARLFGFGAGGGGGGHKRIWSFSSLAAMGGGPSSGGGGGGSGGGGVSSSHARNLKAVGLMVATAVAAAVGLMALAPGMVSCPRWPIGVYPLPGSPHFVPDKPYVDPKAPYNVSSLAVVTGCSATFMDRLENLVASLQYWAPRTRVVVYDIGFTSHQLAEIRCWKGIELRRFPWERFPAHVRELSTYAFKPLTFQLALEEVSDVVLWLDCGLEVRSSLEPVAAALSRLGHVSAQQGLSPGAEGSPPGDLAARYTAPFLNISQPEFERIKMQPYCAGGFQGYVRDSAAHRLILEPVVRCSLHPDDCLAPPGHSRDRHSYDQTALTLAIRHHNFSSCLPRELFATSSTRKTSYDPRQSSSPIVVASRRYRKPKPYHRMIQRTPGCVADPSTNPWVTVASEHTETTAKRASLAAVAEVHAMMIPDFLVQVCSCLGVHLLLQVILWAQVLLAYLGLSWRGIPPRGHSHSHSSGGRHAGSGLSGGGAMPGRLLPPFASSSSSTSSSAPPLSLVAAGSAATMVLSVVVMALAGNVA